MGYGVRERVIMVGITLGKSKTFGNRGTTLPPHPCQRIAVNKMPIRKELPVTKQSKKLERGVDGFREKEALEHV